MPLIVHSSSHCDVCLTEYSWEEGGKRPNAIACGHIFCSECLFLNTPPRCPICRRTYQPNKMKLLHVGRPDEVDDNKEVDLLRRLAVLWDAPDEQLSEIMQEVDTWLESKSEQACVALRSARTALNHSSQMEEAMAQLTKHNTRLQRELQVLHTSSMTNSSKYADLSKKMATKIKDQRSIIRRLQGSEYRYSTSNNPLPSPPQPVLTPDLPTFEQAYSQSAPGVRMVELPPSSTYLCDTETERSAARTTRSSERGAYDEPRYFSPQLATSSHYVQPHIAARREHSPSRRARGSRHAYYENSVPPIAQDPFGLVHAAIGEYANGFMSGAEAALGIEYHRTEPHSASENDLRGSRVVYPHSAPLPNDSSPRVGRRHNTMASTANPPIPNSSPPRQRPRSTSRGGASRSRPPTQRSHTNPQLALILGESTPNLPSRRANGVGEAASSPPQPRFHIPTPRVEPVLVPLAPAQEHRPASPSATITSWGTGNRTDDSLGLGLHATFRTGRHLTFEGGDSVMRFRALRSDGQSIHTSPPQSLGDLASEVGSQFSGSPPRPIGTMVGVLPDERSVHSDDLHTAAYRQARSWDGDTHSRWRDSAYSYAHADQPHRNGDDARSSASGPAAVPHHHQHVRVEPARGEPALATNWRHESSMHGRGLLRDSVALPLAQSPSSRNFDHMLGYRYVPEHVDIDAPGSELSGNALGLELSVGAGSTPSWDHDF